MRFFGIYFIIELILLVMSGKFLGIWMTLSIIFITSIVGMLILRLAGISTLINVRNKANQGQSLDADMMNGMLLGLGGVLLFLPGLLGNVFGVLLVIPMTRKTFTSLAKKILEKYGRRSQFSNTYEKNDNKQNIIDGEWREEDK